MMYRDLHFQFFIFDKYFIIKKLKLNFAKDNPAEFRG